MFHKLIEKKRDLWIQSQECTVKSLIRYIEEKGELRDAQIEAVKTYLYLKIACGNAPLWKLFSQGQFNDTDIDKIALTPTARNILLTNKAAVALLEYSRLTDRNGRQLAHELEQAIKENTESIDYEGIFKKLFYNVSYPDYLFSLPMGAGKTFLMATFVYLDLYFALNEPDNPVFAHNFLILAPSGLKSSIVPSLKKINDFDPAWVIPEPAASRLKRTIKFEVLDEQKSNKKSNRTRNPNAQKIQSHQPVESLMGLVAITKAEKVILDRVDENPDKGIFTREEMNRIIEANELRSVIGKIPHLAIYIDEVHHAADSEIKLRQVVEKWTKEHTFNGVLGFSGTPYLEKSESVTISENLSIKSSELSNVVNYYPLIEGVGNFLKIPTIKTSDNDTETIVRNGVTEFLNNYKDTIYGNGTCAKLAIYCGQIATLEEHVYPQVAKLVSACGLNPAETILKYHGGNKDYPIPKNSESEFATLDTAASKKRIILLVQIGKEGWDCKSLTGVVLPQKGVCPTNMVLQTGCRCLRQVDKARAETAIIWLNKFNADTMNKQLRQQQNITLQELGDKKAQNKIKIERFSRMNKLKVPPIDFYQLKVSYSSLVVEDRPNISTRLAADSIYKEASKVLISVQDISGTVRHRYNEEIEASHERINFERWLYVIASESFGTITVGQLKEYTPTLRYIYI